MVEVAYNPFTTAFDDLATSDLAELNQVHEGWYIEYKGQVVPCRNIAKSLAAFANHYGGWIFYGVESAKGTNIPSAFPGLSHDEVAAMIENIRNAAKDSIYPPPYYEYRVLAGPCNEICLPADRSVLVVAVPRGMNTPYVHRDGRIYRRTSDASDPEPETDRFILDELWVRRARAEEDLSALLARRPILSQAEDGASYMQLYLLQDPTHGAGRRTRLAFSAFAELMSRPAERGLGIAFDNCYTMIDGFVARQVHTNDPYMLVPTFQHCLDGTSLISLPLRKYPVHPPELLLECLNGYKYGTRFARALQQRHTSGSVVDVNLIIVLIASLLSRHIQLIEAGEIRGPVFAKIALDNIWRTTPFLDTDRFATFVETWGLPVVQEDEQYAPVGTTYDSLLRVEDDLRDAELSPEALQLAQAGPLIAQVGNALGIPVSVQFDDSAEWFDAARRAVVVAARNLGGPVAT